jgi:hypothetical protein
LPMAVPRLDQLYCDCTQLAAERLSPSAREHALRNLSDFGATEIRYRWYKQPLNSRFE